MNVSKENKEDFKALPNDFPGNSYGYRQPLKVFRCDINYGACSTRRWNEFILTVHTDKRGLFSLESPSGMLIGVGDVLTVQEYVQYLQTFPKEVQIMMKEMFYEYGFSQCNALLFAVNNTFRMLPSGEGLYRLYFPDNSWQDISGDMYDVVPGDELYNNLGISSVPLDLYNLNLYPNPTSNGNISIHYTLTQNAYIQFKVVDRMGREIILLSTENKSPGTYTQPLDVSSFAAGAYMFIANINGNIQTIKFIKL